MDRDHCTMHTIMDEKVWCDYFDFCCMECSNVEVCPEGLDDESENRDEEEN